jgi:hypothetical protein
VDFAARDSNVLQSTIVQAGQGGLQPRALPPLPKKIPISTEQSENTVRRCGVDQFDSAVRAHLRTPGLGFYTVKLAGYGSTRLTFGLLFPYRRLILLLCKQC